MSELLDTLDEERLREWFVEQRWFGSKAREVAHLNVLEAVHAARRDPAARAGADRGALPVRDARGLPGADRRPAGRRGLDRARDRRDRRQTFYDALADPRARARAAAPDALAASTCRRATGTLGFRWSGGARPTAATVEVRPVGVEQSNSSIVFGEALILKAFRRVEPGVNPELELLRFLSERDFPHIAPIAGWYQYEGRLMDATLGVAAGVPGRRDRRLGPRARRAGGRPRGVPRQRCTRSAS